MTEEERYYKAFYMQNPFEPNLTELDKLEEHCIKTLKILSPATNGFKEHNLILRLIDTYKEQQKEIKQKDKQIDLMAKKISDDDVGEFYYWTKEQIKQYFEQKAKEV